MFVGSLAIQQGWRIRFWMWTPGQVGRGWLMKGLMWHKESGCYSKCTWWTEARELIFSTNHTGHKMENVVEELDSILRAWLGG